MKPEEVFEKASHRVKNVANALIRDGGNPDDVLSAMLYSICVAAQAHGATLDEVTNIVNEVYCSSANTKETSCDS